MSDWKPGDVAMVRQGGRQHVAMRGVDTWSWATEQAAGRGFMTHYDRSGQVVPCRPLVVIDPEDTEQVERLRESLVNNTARPLIHAELVRALREFANPPRPECGHELEVEGRNYEDRYVCRRDKGHAGPHNDTQAAISWTAYPGDVQ